MYPKNYLCILVLLSSFALFGWTIEKVIRALKLAKPEHRFDQIGKRFENVITIAFAQTKIIRQPLAGLVHIGIFWGFLTLLVVIAESIGEGIYTPFSLAFLGPLYRANAFCSDIMGSVVLLSVLVALLRRYIFGPPRVKDIPAASQLDATIILTCIALIMVTMLLANASRISMGAGEHFAAQWRPVSVALASMFGKSPQTPMLFEVFWWLHILFVLGLLNYLPYSKHFHVITSIPNVFFSNKGIHPEGDGALKPLDLEDENAEKFGATDIEDLTWKQLFDSYTCTECGRCTAACPANITGKLLSPKKIITDTRARFKEKAPLLLSGITDSPAMETQLLHNFISAEELWACTTCRACVQECPVMIEHVDEIVDLRRALVLTESEFPELLQVLYRNLENNFAPWQFSPDDRASWADGLDIPQLSELGSAEDVDYLFWVGCAGSYDARYKKVSVAFSKIMQKAGVRFAILGTEEKCNGDAARRTGNEYLAQMLMKENIELMNSYNVKNIVTACPHCLHTLKNEFPQFGGKYNVVHHSEVVRALLDTGILGFDRRHDAKVTFHDSCYLGRYNEIYDDPREALRHVPGLKLVEMPRNRDRGLCCGAGGGQMFMEETVGKRVNIERTEEALGVHPDTIASACPFCMTMLTDGVKEKGTLDVAVRDIAEIVYDAMRK